LKKELQNFVTKKGQKVKTQQQNEINIEKFDFSKKTTTIDHHLNCVMYQTCSSCSFVLSSRWERERSQTASG